MAKFVQDFPNAENPQLFICVWPSTLTWDYQHTYLPYSVLTHPQGYSAGAIFAGCSRPSPSFPQFAPAHYILISYPVDLNPLIGLHKTGSYYRSVEALVQGYGWENLPAEFQGKEPEVAGVLTVMGQREAVIFYGSWTRILGGKNRRNVLKQVVVEGATHAWDDKAYRIVEEVDSWLCTI